MLDFLKNMLPAGAGENIAKMMGFDFFKILEAHLPGWVQYARDFQEKAGRPLLITLALNDQQDNFMLALYSLDAGGATELLRYRLENLESLFDRIQEDLNNLFPTHDTIKPDIQQQPLIGSPADEPADTTTTSATDPDTGAGATSAACQPAEPIPNGG